MSRIIARTAFIGLLIMGFGMAAVSGTRGRTTGRNHSFRNAGSISGRCLAGQRFATISS